MTEHDQTQPVRPLLRVVRGEPTPEQLAAVVAVLAARGPAAAEPEPEPSAWRAQARRAALRRPLPHGPGAWRRSSLPH